MDVGLSKKRSAIVSVVPELPFDIPDPPSLPNSGLQQAAPFTVEGVDFTGALHIRETVVERKVYITTGEQSISKSSQI